MRTEGNDSMAPQYCVARFARSARIAREARLLRRRSGTKKHVPSLLLSTAARDPRPIVSLGADREARFARHARKREHRTVG